MFWSHPRTGTPTCALRARSVSALSAAAGPTVTRDDRRLARASVLPDLSDGAAAARAAPNSEDTRMVSVGEPAPSFVLVDDGGAEVLLPSRLAATVLVFYRGDW